MTSIGLRVKTGKAVVIALAGSAAEPHPILRQEVALADPADAHTAYPYHLELDGDPKSAEAAAQRARRFGATSLARLFATVSADAGRVDSITVVVNTHTPPERITSPHMRAHSKEGWLFREICEHAAEALGIEPLTLALDEIPLADRATRRTLVRLGDAFGRPWAADWKLAAAAAWRALD
jgi:hypothetical protein